MPSYSGTFTLPAQMQAKAASNWPPLALPTVEYLVVAGGGGGGSGLGSGAGAGGFRTASGFAVSTGSAITVTVGAGGNGAASGTNNGTQGSDSVFQYSCVTAWDVSTASYDGVLYSISTQDINPTDVQFKSDGTSFYVLGQNTDTIYQYLVLLQ